LFSWILKLGMDITVTRTFKPLFQNLQEFVHLTDWDMGFHLQEDKYSIHLKM